MTRQWLTKGELHELSKRMDEIEATLELCDPKWDADVIDNLEFEIDQIEARLQVSYDLALKREGRAK